MDAIDRYIGRLSDPALRAYNRALRGLDDQDPGPAGPGATEARVSAAEEALGVALPPSYRKLVTSVHSCDVEYGIYWVPGDGADQFMPDIVSTRQGPNSPLPPFLIAVIGGDDGDEYCFDTRRPDDRGEYPIVHFDHEIHDETSDDFAPVARDLGEFLVASLDGETFP